LDPRRTPQKKTTIEIPDNKWWAYHGTHSLLWSLKLDECHASWAAVSVHDEADAIGLDLVAAEELAHITCTGLEGDALDLQNALPTKPQRQCGLHLLARHLEVHGQISQGGSRKARWKSSKRNITVPHNKCAKTQGAKS
jgi:hypothetical protein